MYFWLLLSFLCFGSLLKSPRSSKMASRNNGHRRLCLLRNSEMLKLRQLLPITSFWEFPSQKFIKNKWLMVFFQSWETLPPPHSAWNVSADIYTSGLHLFQKKSNMHPNFDRSQGQTFGHKVPYVVMLSEKTATAVDSWMIFFEIFGQIFHIR